MLSLLASSPLWNLLGESLALWPRLSLSVLAILLGLLAAWLLQKLTPQQSLNELRQQVRAEFLAWRLFADQPGTWWRAGCRLTSLTVKRLVYLLPGCLLLAPIGYWVWQELELRFQYRPLVAGEQAFITLKWSDTTWPESPAANLITNSAFEIASGPLRDVEEKATYWTVRSLTGEAGLLSLYLPDSTMSWNLQATHEPGRLTSIVLEPATQVGQPGTSPVLLRIDYPWRELSILSWAIPWWGLFLVFFFTGNWLAGRLFSSP